jgi:hypothetical protein
VLDKNFNLILNSQSIDFTSCKAKNPVLGPKRDEVTGEWRKLHNEELHNLYSSPDMRWAGHVARMGEERKVYSARKITASFVVR